MHAAGSPESFLPVPPGAAPPVCPACVPRLVLGPAAPAPRSGCAIGGGRGGWLLTRQPHPRQPGREDSLALPAEVPRAGEDSTRQGVSPMLDASTWPPSPLHPAPPGTPRIPPLGTGTRPPASSASLCGLALLPSGPVTRAPEGQSPVLGVTLRGKAAPQVRCDRHRTCRRATRGLRAAAPRASGTAMAVWPRPRNRPRPCPSAPTAAPRGPQCPPPPSSCPSLSHPVPVLRVESPALQVGSQSVLRSQLVVTPWGDR